MATFNLNIKSVEFDSNLLTSTRDPRVTVLERYGDYTEHFACFYGLDSYNPNSTTFISIPKNINVCQFVGECDVLESYLYTEIAHRFYLLPIPDSFAEEVYYEIVSFRLLAKVIFEFYAKIFEYNNEKA